MNTNGIIAIVAIVVVIVGGILLLGRDGTQEVDLPTTSDTIDNVSDENATDGTGTVMEDKNPSESMMEGGSKKEDSEAMKETPVVTITYSTTGFEPKTVTVNKGGVVRFMNESGSNMWVASAIHPTHTLYPEKSANDCLGSTFDACTGISSGTHWEFTFNEIGSWKYHDHLHANRTGTIEVVAAP